MLQIVPGSGAKPTLIDQSTRLQLSYLMSSNTAFPHQTSSQSIFVHRQQQRRRQYNQTLSITYLRCKSSTTSYPYPPPSPPQLTNKTMGIEPAAANRSLNTIRTELEFLRDSGLLNPAQFQSIMSQLPVRIPSPLHPSAPHLFPL